MSEGKLVYTAKCSEGKLRYMSRKTYVILHPMARISAYAGTDIRGSPQKFVTSICGVPGSRLCKH